MDMEISLQFAVLRASSSTLAQLYISKRNFVTQFYSILRKKSGLTRFFGKIQEAPHGVAAIHFGLKNYLTEFCKIICFSSF